MDLTKLKDRVPDTVLAQIPAVMEKFQINTPLRLCHFLAQCAHESGGFKAVVENLNYGASGLLSIFKKYFPTEAKAKEYERKPEKIANLVYGGRGDWALPLGISPQPSRERTTRKPNHRADGHWGSSALFALVDWRRAHGKYDALVWDWDGDRWDHLRSRYGSRMVVKALAEGPEDRHRRARPGRAP